MNFLSLFNLQRPPPIETPTPRSPKRTILLGKYEVGRRLGSGNFAKVHMARSIETDELVAIKIIDKKKVMGMEERIIREIEAMRRLQDHPNILKIYEVMATKSKIYLVVELAAGGELFTKLITSRRLTESAARRYFQQLVSALSFCHREGIVHRDVKPQNLLLDKEGNIKLSDFGLTALSEHRNSEGLLRTACGTPAYTAPEVIAQRYYDGAKADAWSSGVFLFVLIAGYLPFNDFNMILMYRKIQKREYRFPTSISKQVRTLLYRLLDPNPITRMGLETVMETAWFRKSLETSLEFHSTVFQLENDRLAKPSNDMITAFDLMISLAPGLDISGIFERRKRKEKRFTAKVSAEEVAEKARTVGEKLGYRVEKKEEVTVVGLGKGRTAMVVEAVELAEGLVVGEVKVVEGDEHDEEEEESHWLELTLELDDIVLAWHTDVI